MTFLEVKSKVGFSSSHDLDRIVSTNIFHNHMVQGRCPSQRGGKMKTYGYDDFM